MSGQTPVALVLAGVALVGCGDSKDQGTKQRSTTQAPRVVQGDQQDVLSTIDALQTAARSGDALRICNVVFTKNLAHSIQMAAKRSCPKEVRDRLFTRDETISVERGIRVQGTIASAVIREQNGNVSTLHLVKRAGRWRIDRVIPQKAG